MLEPQWRFTQGTQVTVGDGSEAAENTINMKAAAILFN
jgi:hypothetical protein